jgi:hypothetical protein
MDYHNDQENLFITQLNINYLLILQRNLKLPLQEHNNLS